MIMCARIVRTIIPQIVDIAHLELFDALDFIGIVLDDGINALPVAVARDLFDGIGRALRGKRRGRHRWCCHGRGCPRWGGRV